MKIIQKIKYLSQERKKRKALMNIKATLLSFGYDISMYSDEEIIQDMKLLGKTITCHGFTTEEVILAFTRMSLVLRQENNTGSW